MQRNVKKCKKSGIVKIDSKEKINKGRNKERTLEKNKEKK